MKKKNRYHHSYPHRCEGLDFELKQLPSLEELAYTLENGSESASR